MPQICAFICKLEGSELRFLGAGVVGKEKGSLFVFKEELTDDHFIYLRLLINIINTLIFINSQS